MTETSSKRQDAPRSTQSAPRLRHIGGYQPDWSDKPPGPPPNVGSSAQKPSQRNAEQRSAK